LRLGISIERIRPGHPQQNGRHERMHLTLKKEATRPAGANLFQQQANFDAFLEEFNHERPHEALDMKCPAEVYSSSCRPYQGIGELRYPFHDKITRSATRLSSSPTAAVCACIARRSISVLVWPVGPQGIARLFVESSGSRVTQFTTPFSV
jgi:hypothetical protein